MIKRWCVYLAALLGCGFFFLAYQGWLAWVLLLALAWLPVFSLVLSLPAMLTFRLTVRSSGTVQVGTEVNLTVEPKCVFPVPAYRCRVRVSRALTKESWRLKPGDPLPADHAGNLRCRVEKGWVYDYLGLFRLRIRRCDPAWTLVRPGRVAVAVPSDLERCAALAWRPKFGGGFAENHELRLYRPGDQMNQVHWKLSAKTGKLIVREAMEPLRGNMLLTVDLKGTPAVLDRKMGKLLWMGHLLLERELRFEIRAMTAEGLQGFPVSTEEALLQAVDVLLDCEPAEESVRGRKMEASWRYHIGGDGDED